MNKMEISIKRKYKNTLKITSKAENYNNLNEKLNRCTQKQIWVGEERIGELEDKTIETEIKLIIKKKQLVATVILCYNYEHERKKEI